jgi:hypothetical protein
VIEVMGCFSHRTLVGALLFLLLGGAPDRAAARDSHWFSQVLPTGSIECFYEVLAAGVPVRISAIVMDGGKRDIRVLVRHTLDMQQIAAVEPTNVHVKTFRDTTSRQHLDFTTTAFGEYSFCFDNRPHPPFEGLNKHAVPLERLDSKQPLSKADKFLAFERHFRDSGRKAHKDGQAPTKEQAHLTEGEEETPANIKHAEDIKLLIQQIQDKVDDVQSEANYYHFREEQNRNTAEVGNARIAWLTLLETFVLIAVTGTEIFLVRGWFAKHSPRERSWA